jgi:trimethylamine--corrinoid protein Co-methyltransferase
MRPKLQVLSEDMIGRILEEALRILAETGMEIRGAELRQRLLDSGLKSDGSGRRVFFPPQVVRQAIDDAPGSFTLFDRDGQPYTEIGGDNVHYTPGSSGLKILDHRTGETRLSNSTDFMEYARLCDTLEHIAYPSTAFSTNKDIESQVSDAWRLYMLLITSKKPMVSGAFSEQGVARMVEMLQLFRANRAELIARPMSIFTAIEIVPVTLMGLIAPVTLVGALVFHCVDVLAGLTMAQIVRPGTPVLFGGAPATFHMKAASSPMAAIEAQHLNAGYVAIAKHLGLPCQAYMALSDGKFLDAQAGGETFSSALLAAIAGVNSVSGPGMLDFVLTFSLPKLVFDNEVCGQSLHFVREIEVLDDLPTQSLVDDLMREDHLITSPHTLAQWPDQLYLTDPVFDRENRETWQKQGEKDLLQRATEEVERRLGTYSPIETDPEIDQAMRQLVLDGMESQDTLPELPPLAEPAVADSARGRRGRAGRRRRRG